MTDLKGVRQELTTLAPNLITAVGPIQARHLLAAFATEVAARSMTRASVTDYVELLEWSCVLVRGHSGSADAFDEAWFSAYMASIEAVFNVPMTRVHADHVRQRSPRHPELARSDALDYEIRMLYGGHSLSHVLEDGKPPPTIASRSNLPKDAINKYKPLLEDAEFASEARTRLAYLQIVTGKLKEALATLAGMPTTDDPTVQFWAALLRGTAQRELGHLPEATAAFREAVKIAPRASSANIALAGALQLSGSTDEAHQITEELLRSGPGSDPWYSYFRGSFRKIDRLLDDVRTRLR